FRARVGGCYASRLGNSRAVSGISHYLPATIKNRPAWRLKIIYFLRHHLTGEAHTTNFDALTEHEAASISDRRWSTRRRMHARRLEVHFEPQAESTVGVIQSAGFSQASTTAPKTITRTSESGSSLHRSQIFRDL
ncbi:MAG TPA: hypothetical protein VE860_07140, partial [Chthoniobacterales bacterium]|nr:hypothetical protein [Chthoniobacterales bacterium]